MMVRRLMVLGLMASMMAGALALSGCASRTIDPEFLPVAEKAAFEARPGMRRDRVEQVWGFPAAVGRTKDDQPMVQYRFGNHVRTVIYDERERVLVSYP